MSTVNRLQEIATNYRGEYDGNTFYRMFDEVLAADGLHYICKVAEISGRDYHYPAYWVKVSETKDEKSGYGIFHGLGVTAHGTPDLAVAVAAGTAYAEDGTRFTPAAVASLAVTAANATNGRKDLVYLSSAGVVTYLAGTAAASPTIPATPTGGFALAEIAVAANATTVVTGNITDKRKRYNEIST